MTSTESIRIKAFKVIDSCKTLDQLTVAERFAVLVHNRVTRRLSPAHYYAPKNQYCRSRMAKAINRKEIEIVSGCLNGNR